MYMSRRIRMTCLSALALGSTVAGEERAGGVAAFEPPPGMVIHHSPHGTGSFLGSPSIVVLGKGDYVVSHDRYGARMADSTTHIYRSRDAGQTWQSLADIEDIGLHWASLFHHEGRLFLMGADSKGHTVILRSDDSGRAWTRPVDENTGRLIEGTYHPLSPSWLVHDGRVWKPNEYAAPGVRWGPRFETFMMSAPLEADWLKRDSWVHSNRLGYEPQWLNGRFGGWLEGNAVVTPEGQLVNMLRVQFGHDRFTQTWRGYDGDGKAAVVRISEDGRRASFDPDHDFIEFPGGLVRFQIRYDAVSGYYWSLTSYVPPAHRQAKRISDRIRNTLALIASRDLRTWTVRDIILYHPDPLTRGFQNVAWEFDGDDIVWVSRSSWPDETSASARFQIDQAHDANYITFHRMVDFRERPPAVDPEAQKEGGAHGSE